MTSPDLEIAQASGLVWRVGYAPNLWEWSDWRFAQDNGRFDGRWDDEDGKFRTIYTAESLFACLVEVLAKFRPDPVIETELGEIEDPDDRSELYPEYPAGTPNKTATTVSRHIRPPSPHSGRRFRSENTGFKNGTLTYPSSRVGRPEP